MNTDKSLKTDLCSLGAKFVVPGVLPIVYASQEILTISVIFLPVRTETRESLNNFLVVIPVKVLILIQRKQ